MNRFAVRRIGLVSWLAISPFFLAFAPLFTGCGGTDTPARPSPHSVPGKMDNAGASLSGNRSEQLVELNTEAYDAFEENPFINAMREPQSTFSIDVDTASYSNVRRMISHGQLPPKGAVRIEELVNYFDYDYPEPEGKDPFAVSTELAPCPWTSEHQLLRIALKGRTIPKHQRQANNLVFLLDVSGSMMQPDKLPLVKSAMKLLVKQLDAKDRIAIVVYAGASGLVLPSTSVEESPKILDAIEQLSAGGSTNGAAGIQLAYQVAQQNFLDNGNNRVILCTDGDFNVGLTSQSDLIELISAKAERNIFLTVLGFGSGNLKDSTMEKLADKGNGNYAYIDSLQEARKVLLEQAGSTLVTIAKDVKIQLDFNPQCVESYRLIGYENRVLANQDFRDDAKDAGEIGAGHTVTAFYEIVPVSNKNPSPNTLVRASEFVEFRPNLNADSKTMLTVNLRYKHPKENQGQEFQVRVSPDIHSAVPSADFQFATAVIGYGMLLRGSSFKGEVDWDWVIETAQHASSQRIDTTGLRSEFVQLAKTAKQLIPNAISAM